MNRAITMSGFAGLGAMVFIASLYAERYQPGAVLAAPLVLGAGSIVVAACMGKPWAVKVCLFVLIVGADLSFRHRDTADLSIDGSVIYRLVLWSAAFVIGLANLSASIRYFRNGSYLGLLAYVLLAAGSAIYSLTPTYTLGCAYGYLCMLLFAAAVVARLDLKEILYVAMLAIGTHVLIAIVLWFVAPDVVTWRNWSGTEGRLRGLLGHPFRMADGAAMFLLSAVILWRLQWLTTQAFALVGLLGSYALLLTQTRSSIAAVVLALFSAGRLRPASATVLTAVFLGALIAIHAFPGTLDAIARQISRSGSVESTLTLTGRTQIWQQSFRLFSERPLLGYGFAATRSLFPKEFVATKSGADVPSHAHNVVVQSLVATGIVGTLLLLIPLLVPVIHSLRHRDGLANPLTWYVTIAGFAGLGLIGGAPRAVTVFWMLSLLMVKAIPPETAAVRTRDEPSDPFERRQASLPPVSNS